MSPLSHATGWLQDVETEAYSSDDLDVAEDLASADVWTSSIGLRRATVSLEVPREDLTAGLELFDEVLRRPVYPGKEVKRYVREQRRFYLEEAPTSPARVAGSLLGFAWYPADHAYGTRPDPDGISALKRKDLQQRHAWLLAHAPVTVLVVGDVVWADLEPALRPIFESVGAAGVESEPPAFEPPGESRVVAVDMPGEQTTLHLRMAAPPAHHGDRGVMYLVDWALGGHFMSRLNRNLREEKGFTYGIGSWYTRGQNFGTWSVSVDVAAENTRAAVAEIEAEVARVVEEGVTADEIASAHLESVTSWNTTLQTAGDAFGLYDGLVTAREVISDPRARIEAQTVVTPPDTQRVAREWLAAERPRLWVVVGPRAVVEPQLGELGWDVDWVSPQDAVLGKLP